MVTISEYGAIGNNAPRVQETKIAEAPSLAFPKRMIRFVEKNEGWACAGSMARWDDACFSVLFYDDGATHGRRFKKREDAAALFKTWTGVEA